MALKEAVFPFDGDFILFAYILAAGKFTGILGALDTGSSFEGMGASREASFTSFIEPAFFIILASLSVLSGSSSFEKILSLPYLNNGLLTLITALIIASLLIMLITEGSRVPVDDPNTHLELTMIHEVMVLDNSGPDLALINYGSGMKMVVITSLIASLVIPGGRSLLLSVLLFTAVQVITAAIIGSMESFITRMRMSQVPKFVLLMTSLALIVLSLTAFFSFGDRR
jgi:formate hydrogenlyase subunit 4